MRAGRWLRNEMNQDRFLSAPGHTKVVELFRGRDFKALFDFIAVRDGHIEVPGRESGVPLEVREFEFDYRVCGAHCHVDFDASR